MPPDLQALQKHLSGKLLKSPKLMRLKQEVMGLAEDLWADGPDNLFGLDFFAPHAPKGKKKAANLDAHPYAEIQKAAASSLWHAAPGELAEKMWGQGFVTAGGAALEAMLVKPLNLKKEMSVLDLAAGLGGPMRLMQGTGAAVTGLEMDAAMAARGNGKETPIRAFDRAKPLEGMFDAVIAREIFYRMTDRAAFTAGLAKNLKPKAQAAFTDYILDPEHRENPAVLGWKLKETAANPIGLVETAEMWAKAGFNLTTHEDLTDFYKAEVKAGMKNLMMFIASGVHLDKRTMLELLQVLEMWKHRVAALEGGMKFYRFHGARGIKFLGRHSGSCVA